MRIEYAVGMPDSTYPRSFTHAAIFCLSVGWDVLGSFCSDAAGGEHGSTYVGSPRGSCQIGLQTAGH